MKEIHLDAHSMKTPQEAHRYLKKVLSFPDYYGENLDALYDCLGDIAEALTIYVPSQLAQVEYLGSCGQTMLHIFDLAAQENKYLTVKKI